MVIKAHVCHVCKVLSIVKTEELRLLFILWISKLSTLEQDLPKTIRLSDWKKENKEPDYGKLRGCWD